MGLYNWWDELSRGPYFAKVTAEYVDADGRTVEASNGGVMGDPGLERIAGLEAAAGRVPKLVQALSNLAIHVGTRDVPQDILDAVTEALGPEIEEARRRER